MTQGGRTSFGFRKALTAEEGRLEEQRLAKERNAGWRRLKLGPELYIFGFVCAAIIVGMFVLVTGTFF